MNAGGDELVERGFHRFDAAAGGDGGDIGAGLCAGEHFLDGAADDNGGEVFAVHDFADIFSDEEGVCVDDGCEFEDAGLYGDGGEDAFADFAEADVHDVCHGNLFER